MEAIAMGAEKPLNEPPKTAKELSQDILEGFLPAMAQIQAMPDKTDEQKKRLAQDWLRSRLDRLVVPAGTSPPPKTPPRR
jgi:hypothetical protein